jgi:hypothetical protein
MVLHFVLGQVGKNSRKNNNHMFRSSQTLPSDSFMQLFIIVAGFLSVQYVLAFVSHTS